MEDTRVLPRIIGISGKFGSGKSTFCSYFLSKHKEYTKESFAESLRMIVAILTNQDIALTRTAEGKKTFLPHWDKTIGELLQIVGTDCIRQNLPNAWILSLFERFNNESHWIIDDVRFPNEANAIKEAGGIVIRFEGDPGHIYSELCKTRNPNHESETALDSYTQFDYIIDTNQYKDDIDSLHRLLF